jgi:hypothetical protein
MSNEDFFERESAGGVWNGFPYEQVLNEDGEPAFLVYHKTPFLDKLHERQDRSWTEYYMMEKYLDDSEKGVRLVPMKRTPWPLAGPFPEEKLDHKSLWNTIRKFLYEHIDFYDDLLYDVATGWTFASYHAERWTSVPYLFMYGPHDSGKTRVLDCLNSLCYRSLMMATITGPALFRGIEKWHPTLLLDETGKYNAEAEAEIRSILNAGYRKGQFAARCEGENHEIKLFDVFGFKAMADIKDLNQTLRSRCIVINMYQASRKVRFTLNRKEATRLRTQLLMSRLEEYEAIERIEELEGLDKAPKALCFADGRFVEKYYPLYMVSNEGRTQILEYARKTHQLQQFAEETSIEAQVTEAVANCLELVKNGVVRAMDIRTEFNKDRNDKEQWKTRQVSSIVKRLGFHNKRAWDGNAGYIWNEETLQRNLRRYSLTDPSPEPSSPSNASNASTKDRIIYNIDDSECAICHEVPEQLYPDANSEYWICKKCKQRQLAMSKIDGVKINN